MKERFTFGVFGLFLLLINLGFVSAFSGSGAGTSGDPFVILNCTQLQEMNESLSANYSLGNNINCSDTINWNGGQGFEPVGIVAVPFVGRFDGKGNNISGLNINRTTIDFVGLFGYAVGIGGEVTLENVGLIDVNLLGQLHVGALVGYVYKGSVNNSHSAGKVNGVNNIGGLVGYSNLGSVNNSYSTGIVNGSTYVGGLVGRSNLASIDNSYATGNITGMGGVPGTGAIVGGLVGGISSSSFISNSYSTGNIIATSDAAGGLTGDVGSGCSIDNSYATGNVSGEESIGGLIGIFYGDYINNSHATGNVLGVEDNTGGLVGYVSGGSIIRSYATGKVSGAGNFVGGLAGAIYSAATIWKSYATGNVSGSLSGTGGLVGYVDNSFVKDSYANGTVLGADNVGGLVGYGYYGLINNSYFAGNVNGTAQRIAGLVGYPSFSNVSDSFVTGKVYGTSVGEITGVGEGSVSNCYWYNNTDDDATACIGDTADACDDNGKNTLSYFYGITNPPMDGWDFITIWNSSCDGVSYPILLGLGGSVPVLTVSLTGMANMTVTQGNSFTFSSNVTCSGGDCGNVSAYLDPALVKRSADSNWNSYFIIVGIGLLFVFILIYFVSSKIVYLGIFGIVVLCGIFVFPNLTGFASNTLVSTTVGAIPFYTISMNPQNCSNMADGESCTNNWTVYATGDTAEYGMFVIYNSTTSGVEEANTSSVYITLNVSATAVASEGASSGGGSYLPTNVNISRAQLEEGYSDRLSAGSRMNFKINGESFELLVESVSGSRATIKITDGKTVTKEYNVGDGDELDLNSDGTLDLIVEIREVSGGMSKVFIKQILVEEEPNVGTEIVPEKKAGFNLSMVLILGILLILAGFAAYKIAERKRKLRK